MGSISSFATTSMRQAEHAADVVRDRAHDAADLGNSALDRLGVVIDDLQSILARAQKISGREYPRIRRQLSKKLEAAGETLDALSGDAAVVARRTLKRTNKHIRAHPLQAVGVVAAVGLILGFLLARRPGE